MKNAYIIDAIRTPFGRYAGGLAPVRADDLGAIPIKALMERNPSINWEKLMTLSTAVPTRPVKTTATWVVCQHCLQVYLIKCQPLPLTVFADPPWMQ